MRPLFHLKPFSVHASLSSGWNSLHIQSTIAEHTVNLFDGSVHKQSILCANFDLRQTTHVKAREDSNSEISVTIPHGK